MSNYDGIDKALDVEASIVPEGGCLPRKKQLKDAIDKTDIDRDYEYSRGQLYSCLLYTSPSPRDVEEARMPSSA